MRSRDLGDSGISVSAISLGSWLTYSGGIEREQTEACTKAAFDAGITLFDTANVYGRKLGEGFTYYSNPEFLREGSSVKDFYAPPFTLIGAPEGDDAAAVRAIAQVPLPDSDPVLGESGGLRRLWADGGEPR